VNDPDGHSLTQNMGNNRGLTKRTQCGEIFYDGMSMWEKSRRIRKSDKINFYQDIMSFFVCSMFG
jgi:hypothetical protein